MINNHEVVRVLPDWESGSVDYAAPPCISFDVAPPIAFDEQYPIQLGIDTYIEQGNESSGILLSTIKDIQRAYNIKVIHDTTNNISTIECTFPGVRRSHLASTEGVSFIKRAVEYAIQARPTGEN